MSALATTCEISAGVNDGSGVALEVAVRARRSDAVVPGVGLRGWDGVEEDEEKEEEEEEEEEGEVEGGGEEAKLMNS